MCVIPRSLFILPIGVMCRLCSMIVIFPGFLYYLKFQVDHMEAHGIPDNVCNYEKVKFLECRLLQFCIAF